MRLNIVKMEIIPTILYFLRLSFSLLVKFFFFLLFLLLVFFLFVCYILKIILCIFFFTLFIGYVLYFSFVHNILLLFVSLYFFTIKKYLFLPFYCLFVFYYFVLFGGKLIFQTKIKT